MRFRFSDLATSVVLFSNPTKKMENGILLTVSTPFNFISKICSAAFHKNNFWQKFTLQV